MGGIIAFNDQFYIMNASLTKALVTPMQFWGEYIYMRQGTIKVEEADELPVIDNLGTPTTLVRSAKIPAKKEKDDVTIVVHRIKAKVGSHETLLENSGCQLPAKFAVFTSILFLKSPYRSLARA